jgi:hypothetical protein
VFPSGKLGPHNEHILLFRHLDNADLLPAAVDEIRNKELEASGSDHEDHILPWLLLNLRLHRIASTHPSVFDSALVSTIISPELAVMLPSAVAALATKLAKLVRVLEDNIGHPKSRWLWHHDTNVPGRDATRQEQVKMLSCNFHITHVWLQHLILEEMVEAFSDTEDVHSDTRMSFNSMIWQYKQRLCVQLLSVVKSTPQYILASSGASIVGCHPLLTLSSREAHRIP